MIERARDVTDGDVRPVRYVPGNRVLDLGRPLPEADYQLLVSLHGQIGRGDKVLKCESTGGDPWLYVYQHEDGFLARHFPGGGHHGNHAITRESDEHRRCKDYSASNFGFPAALEVPTDNRTRLDVATLDAPRISGVEVQIGHLKVPELRRRTTLSMRATAFVGKYARPLPDGVLPVWLHPFGMPLGWGYPVPSIAAQDTPWDVTPKPGTVTAIGVRRIAAEKCRIGGRWNGCPRGRGYCGDTHPYAELQRGLTVDAVLAMVAAGQLVPLRYFTGVVYLVDPASAVLYQELGGDGAYAAGTPGASAHKLGPCRNYGHDIQAPAAVQASDGPPSTFPAFLAQAIRVRGWRCVRCGTVTPADPCPECDSWRVTQIRERVRLEPAPAAVPAPAAATEIRPVIMPRPRSRPSECDTPGCAQPGRLYPHGLRCDTHRPRPAPYPQATGKVP